MSEAVILLPARNEEEGIGEVIERIPKDEIGKLGFATRVVVVDRFDGLERHDDTFRELAAVA